MKKIVDITGRRFGKLTALYPVNTINRHYKWRCKCECGNQKDIQGGHLRSGHTTSCGCTWYRYGEENPTWKGHKEISSKFFKSIISNAKVRNIPFKLTIVEAWDLFIKQNRKCVLTGIPLQFEANNGRIKGNASLDRIDSSKAYTIDNVQWVHVKINNMKWDMSQDGFILMCKSVCDHQSSK